MKDFIKNKIRENMNVNSLGIQITRPEQVLIIMRGISGSGKSTKAKSLAGNGVIHSTDDLIAASGDYNEFFQKMKASGNGSMLSNMHSTNLSNAKKSLDQGVSPVVIDNTNLTHAEPKEYVKYALSIGLADNNIEIVDIGTGGQSVEALAARNTHGVPLDKINMMSQRYQSAGPMTLQKILAAKDMSSGSDILYSCVLLDNDSHQRLVSHFMRFIPAGWPVIAHHMTIAFGKSVPNREDIGKHVRLTGHEIGISDMAIALRVHGYPSLNVIPHITLAINPNGGKPVMSNDIKDWKVVPNFHVFGNVTEIKKQ